MTISTVKSEKAFQKICIKGLVVSTQDDDEPKTSDADISLKWYLRWLQRRIAQLPPEIVNGITSMALVSSEVAEMAKKRLSLEDMATKLVDLSLVKSHGRYLAQDIGRVISFTFLGWQSMLFDPVPTLRPGDCIEIADTLDGYCSVSFASRHIHYPPLAASLPDLLIGFGLMLPKENQCMSQAEGDIDAFEEITFVTPRGLSAANLSFLAKIKFKWIDVMGAHLEFDKETKSVFLYRFPSFCLANVRRDDTEAAKGVIHGLATDDRRNRSWASENEVTQLMQEILLSYRLLFGQEKDSRKLYRSMKVFSAAEKDVCDDLLSVLCGRAKPGADIVPADQEGYRLSRDFPILRARLAILQQQLGHVKPRGWRTVWKDRRDTVQWYTFWAVIFFGGMGLIMSTLQVILQAIQTFRGR